MKRTLAEARRDFEESIAPRANDPTAKRCRDILAAAEQRAREYANSYVLRREQEALALRNAALRELTATRDECDDLGRTATEGRTGVADLSEQLSKLRARQAHAEDQLGRAEKVAEEIGKVEADPVGWYDDQSSRLKHLKQDFPW